MPQEGESGSSLESWPTPQHSLEGLSADHRKDRGRKQDRIGISPQSVPYMTCRVHFLRVDGLA